MNICWLIHTKHKPKHCCRATEIWEVVQLSLIVFLQYSTICINYFCTYSTYIFLMYMCIYIYVYIIYYIGVSILVKAYEITKKRNCRNPGVPLFGNGHFCGSSSCAFRCTRQQAWKNGHDLVVHFAHQRTFLKPGWKLKYLVMECVMS